METKTNKDDAEVIEILSNDCNKAETDTKAAPPAPLPTTATIITAASSVGVAKKEESPPLPPRPPPLSSMSRRQLSLTEIVSLQSRRTVNFSASDIAAICGFHPYKNLPNLLYKLVYAGSLGAILQRLDIQALGLAEDDSSAAVVLASEEEIWKSLAAQAGSKTIQAFNKALDSQTTPKSIQEAKLLKEEIIKEAKASGKLKPQELKILKEGTRHVINTRFGNHHEDNALDLAETKFGWEIYDRNQEIMEWEFRRKIIDDGTTDTTGTAMTTSTVEPIQHAKARYRGARRRRSRQQQQQQQQHGDDNNGNHDGTITTTKGKRQKRDEEMVLDLTIQEDEATTNIKTSMSSSDDPHSESIVKENGPSTKEKEETEFSASAMTTNASSDKSDSNNIMEEAKDNFSPEGATASTESTAATVAATANLLGGVDEGGDPYPYLVIRGSVDGRRDEMIPSTNPTNDGDDEFGDWELRPVVVELKHRMNRLFSSPPLYEQIQAVAYCLMYQVSEADLVQCLRQEQQQQEEGKEHEEEQKESIPTKKEESTATSEKQPAGVKAKKEDNNTETADAEMEADSGSDKEKTLLNYFSPKPSKKDEEQHNKTPIEEAKSPQNKKKRNTLLNYFSPKGERAGASDAATTHDMDSVAGRKPQAEQVKEMHQVAASPTDEAENRDPNSRQLPNHHDVMDVEFQSAASENQGIEQTDNVEANANNAALVKPSIPNAGEVIAEMMLQSVQSLSPFLGVPLVKHGDGAADRVKPDDKNPVHPTSAAGVHSKGGNNSKTKESELLKPNTSTEEDVSVVDVLSTDPTMGKDEENESSTYAQGSVNREASVESQKESVPTGHLKDGEKQGQRSSSTSRSSSRPSRQQRRRKPPKRLTMQADRISLYDQAYQHEKNWYQVILPRLCSFASAVYSIRRDDSKRYRLLHACSDPLGQLEREAWELLFEECAWLKDCDTAFRRSGGARP